MTCLQKFYVIALAFVGIAAADVSHLKLGLSADGGYGLSTSSSSSFSSSSSSEVVPGGDYSSYQPAEYTPEHLKSAEVVPGGESISYQPAEYQELKLWILEVSFWVTIVKTIGNKEKSIMKRGPNLDPF